MHQLKETTANYWLMGFNPARAYQYFDLQANTFCLLLGIGDENNHRAVIDYIKKLYERNQSMLPSFYPTIKDTDKDMHELKNNYAYSFRNKPGCFHNGGLWPVWNGWLAAALYLRGEKDFSRKIITAIHRSNADHFNECLQGDSLIPCGIPNCTWSAAGAIIAEQAVINDDLKGLFKFNQWIWWV